MSRVVWESIVKIDGADQPVRVTVEEDDSIDIRVRFRVALPHEADAIMAACVRASLRRAAFDHEMACAWGQRVDREPGLAAAAFKGLREDILSGPRSIA